MLRDLEQRRSEQGRARTADAGTVAVPRRRQRWVRRLFSGSLLMVVTLVALWLISERFSQEVEQGAAILAPAPIEKEKPSHTEVVPAKVVPVHPDPLIADAEVVDDLQVESAPVVMENQGSVQDLNESVTDSDFLSEQVEEQKSLKNSIQEPVSEPEVMAPSITSHEVILLQDLLPIEIPVGVPSKDGVEGVSKPGVAEQNPLPIEEPDKESMKVVLPPSPEELADQAYASAVTALQSGDVKGAEHALNSALQQHATHRGALEAYTALLVSSGRHQEAEIYVSQGLQHHPQSVLFLQLKARLLMHAGSLHQATDLLESRLPAIEQSVDGYVLLAAIYQKQQQFEKAADLYRRLLMSDRTNGVWEMGLGIALESLGKFEEAQSHYQAAYQSGRLKAVALDFVRRKLKK